MSKTRTEKDTMGALEVPENALYGASTQRAAINFPISNLRFDRNFLKALGIIKASACKANLNLGLLPEKQAGAILEAAQELIDGKLDEHFVVDIFQTGSGTSTNMNANEVLANRACQLLGGKIGDRSLVHPNDHVNMSQSSNDVIPSAIHVAAKLCLNEKLLPTLVSLEKILRKKGQEFNQVIKAGRTHLQDATPVTLGQEFSGYAEQIKKAHFRLARVSNDLSELALGGTAVGTGLNANPKFAAIAIKEISAFTKLDFKEASDHFMAQGSQDIALAVSGELRTLANALLKIANDIRWLASGPRCGLGEINLPAIQPGSSIMPAKVNPVISESTMMVCAKVIGNDTCISMSAQHGNLELNTMLPIIAYSLLESIELLSTTSKNLGSQGIAGITANEKLCLEYAEKSLATCTPLAVKIGYDQAANIAKKALAENKTVKQVAKELGVLSEEELSKVLDLKKMTTNNN